MMLKWMRYVYFTSAVMALVMAYALPVSAQDCSRNMLKIAGPGSYVATPDVLALHLTKGFTIECWAKEDNYNSLAALFDKSGSKQFGYGLFFDTSSTIFGVVRHANAIRLYSPSLDSLRNWHHFVFVCKPGDSLYLYVDTFEVASASIKTISSIDSTTDSLRIGMSAARQSFIGDIDEFRVWNVPHSLSVIKSTLYRTLAPNDPTL